MVSGARTATQLGLLVAVGILLAGLLAPPAQAAFTPGRFVLDGKALAARSGKGIAVYRSPQAVTLDGCRTRRARVRPARRGVRLKATVRCGNRKLTLSARVRGRLLRGVARSGKKVRHFRARRARQVGVLLKGKSSQKAIRAVGNVDRLQRHPPDTVSKLGRGRVARRELVVRLKRGTTVGQVNGLLRALGGGIVGSLRRSPALIVAIPDPGGVRALERIARRGARRRGIASVSLSRMVETQQLPSRIASPPSSGQRDALSHLLASGVAAAWNARAAIRLSEQPTVVVADSFGDGPLSRHVDANASPRIGGPHRVNGVLLRGKNHGYQVASIIFGDFANDGTRAGLVTGVFPAHGRLITIDVIDSTLPGAALKLINTLTSVSGHAVVNTSLGRNGGQIDKEMFPEASDWIRDVQNNHLEQRVLHATAAGNDASSARFNGLWAASALRNDIEDRFSGGVVGPLSNTLAVENVKESEDSSQLACLVENSNLDGTIAAPGNHVYSLDRDGRVDTDPRDQNGTSYSTPVIAGIATYLWSIAPDLTPQQLKAALVLNGQPVADTEQNCVSAPRVDAYAATLSLDEPGPPSLAGSPVRRALLDLDGDGKFGAADLQAWLPKVSASRAATVRDWSRHDLNGDGFTGGGHTKSFDLDRTGSVRAGKSLYGSVSATIRGVNTSFDENAVTDLDVLCYYANSALYTDSPSQRDAILGTQCRPPHLYWAMACECAHEIGRANLDGTGVNQGFLRLPDGASDVAIGSGHIFWVDGDASRLGRANLDGSGVNQTLVSSQGEVRQLAVDDQHVYWANRFLHTIGRADLDGGNPNQSFIDTGSPPFSVAVDGQHIYWSNLDQAIGRADVNGTNVNQTFISGGAASFGVAVDGQHIYWEDTSGIGRADLNGTNVNGSFITVPGSNSVRDLAVDGQHIYWSNESTNKIGRANLDGTRANQSFISLPSFGQGLAVG